MDENPLNSQMLPEAAAAVKLLSSHISSCLPRTFWNREVTILPARHLCYHSPALASPWMQWRHPHVNNGTGLHQPGVLCVERMSLVRIMGVPNNSTCDGELQTPLGLGEWCHVVNLFGWPCLSLRPPACSLCMVKLAMKNKSFTGACFVIAAGGDAGAGELLLDGITTISENNVDGVGTTTFATTACTWSCCSCQRHQQNLWHHVQSF